MADVRSLLKNERAARQISHPHATYSTTGTLVCLVCHIQLKSESLWNGHLRSAQHAMRMQRIRDGTLGRPPGAPSPITAENDRDRPAIASKNEAGNGSAEVGSKKRKADVEIEAEEVRKRSRAGDVPEAFFDEAVGLDVSSKTEKPVSGGQETRLPSRPATPLKTTSLNAQMAKEFPQVDEDEWAAFEADIAAATVPDVEEAIISAPAMSVADLAARNREDENALRKERQEAELEGDKEDAARKMQVEFEEMEELEGRLRRLKERREALRFKSDTEPNVEAVVSTATSVGQTNGGEDNEDDSDDYDDDWDGFRIKA